MATQLGTITITEVNGDTFSGSYESIYTGNVGTGDSIIGAHIIVDAWEQFDGHNPAWTRLVTLANNNRGAFEELADYIESCIFETPDQQKTNYTIKVTNPGLIAAFKPITWESYGVG